MKKFIYIGVLFLAVALASCSKDAFKIQDDEEREVPAWECETKGLSTEDDSIVPDVIDTDQGGITDPNNDPDGRKKKP